ncbi:hypothetical protein SIN8267_01209 [Sinobacterium norvegicum]|uniref:VWFA domain-containing protein n=1 Tax=Sinobacterium norvegicum TaxID=1641715 RepID=A0ABM9AD32_9GAMM|nr:VWA domain-containing protein [Sinobacterium norvegicum]CAH0991108.1 hypothetical protein SIN8267_01209 [Sinobacterium norvegicum]
MIRFDHPWMLLLLLLPVLMVFLPSHKTQVQAIKYSRFKKLLELSGQHPSSAAVILRRRVWQKTLAVLSYVSLVIAACYPVYYGQPFTVEQSGRQMIAAVDLSGSMEASDFEDDLGRNQRRVDVVKTILDDFLKTRQSDRIALVAFGDDAYLQAPFTSDYSLLSTLLNEMDVRMAGSGTALGDAIGVAVNHFEGSKVEHKVLLLLTDGRDTSSRFSPLDAARHAGEKHITIYPIAIGNPENVGEEAMDMEMLAELAELTGGQVFSAMNADDMRRVYDEIDRLEPELFSSHVVTPKTPLYFYPIIVCLTVVMLSLLLVMLVQWLRRRVRPSLEVIDE